VLSKMVRPIKLLTLVTLAEFMFGGEMINPSIPLGGGVGEFLAAVTTDVCEGRSQGGWVEGGFVVAC
jgi:hypothetical protein